MAYVVREVPESRDIEGTGDLQTGHREFLVFDDGTGTVITSPFTVASLFGTATTPDLLPTYGNTFPDYPNLGAVRARIGREPGSRGIWRVTWPYAVLPAGGLTPQTVGYVDISVRASEDFFEMWRQPGNHPVKAAPLTFPANGDASGFADIGGEPVDSGGEPGSAQRFQQVIEFSEVVNGLPDFSTFRPAIGARNSHVFLGGEVGKVVLTALVSARVSLTAWRLTFPFVYDDFFHMQQKPRREVNAGIEKLGANYAPWDATATNVYWIQPFKKPKFDFSTISNYW